MYRDNTVQKIEQLQFLLAAGKSKTEVAKALGYKDHQGLYKFAARHKLVWNHEKKNYEATGNDGKPIEAVKPPIDNPTGRVASVISMFDKGMDGREIARKLRFGGHQAMADFMKSKGYVWKDSIQNYEKQASEAIENTVGGVILPEAKHIANGSCNCMDKYGAMLKFLEENKDKLSVLLDTDCGSKGMPRYTIPGVIITKSIGMNNNIDRLVRVSQKEMFEIAIIDFLRNYGYRDEVKAHLKL